MNIQHYLDKDFNNLLPVVIIISMLGFLASCTPGRSEDLSSSPFSITPLSIEGTEMVATLTTPPPLTPSTDESLSQIFTPNPITSAVILSSTPTVIISTLVSTPSLVGEPFDFQGKIVFSVAHDKNANESALWLLIPPEAKAHLLLQDEGVGLSQPLFSPTGRYLAYIRYTEDSANIWVLDMVTKETNQWSSDFSINYIVRQDSREAQNGIILQSWSPNEQALVFQMWERDVPLDEPIWSYALFANGETKQLGSRIYDISWSPVDANELVYIAGLEGIYRSSISEALTPTPILETPELYGGSISWHPSGQHLAIVADLIDETPLWIVDLDTGGIARLTEGVPGAQLVRWSPDGRLLFWKLQDSSQVLKFQDDTFESFTVQPLPGFDPYLDTIREQIWSPDSSYLGLIQGFPTVAKGIGLCFYSVSGEKLDCPASSEAILGQLGIDKSTGRATLTWVLQDH